jgi:sugar/nucleoside kinase (ribokinase family)
VFHRAFVHAAASGSDLVAALDYAAAVASLRVTHAGTRSWLSDPALARLAEGIQA